MSAAWQYYIITLLVYCGVNMIAVWGLNLQFGLGGILNFAYIIFEAVGAYVAAALTLGPASQLPGKYQTYILGAHLPWPVPVLAAGAAGGLLALVVGAVALRPKRVDYQGMALLTVSLIVTVLVVDNTGLFNGSAGLAGVPRPLDSALGLGFIGYGWFYAALTAAVTLVMYVVVRRLSASPWGRQLRALRENPNALKSLGIDIDATRLKAFVVGGVIAGVAGAVRVQFVGAWAPGSWATAETFFFLVAVIIGGRGNTTGAALGSVVLFTFILNGVQYLPVFSYTTVAVGLQAVAVGVAFIVFIALRPEGLIPERAQRFGPRRRAVAIPSSTSA